MYLSALAGNVGVGYCFLDAVDTLYTVRNHTIFGQRPSVRGSGMQFCVMENPTISSEFSP